MRLDGAVCSMNDGRAQLFVTAGAQSPVAPQWVRVAFVVAAFSLPWSSDVQNAFGPAISRLFQISQALIVLYWVLRIEKPFRSLPKSFNAFALLALLHIAVTYGVLHPQDLFVSDFGAAFGIQDSDSVVRGVVVVKLIMSILMGYALASMVDGSGDVKRIGFAIGSSVALLMVVGRSSGYREMGERFSGGYANPNAFAEVCVAVIFLNIFTTFAVDSSRSVRLASLAMVIVGVSGLLLSASRSSTAGLVLGVCAMAIATGARSRLVLALVAGFTFLVLLLAFSSGAMDLIYRRSTESIVNLRTLIWSAYLQHWRDYIALGVGLGREMTVLNSPIFMNHIWPPHNTILQATVAYGFLGPAFLVAFMSRAIRDSWRAARRRQHIEGSSVMLGIACCWFVLMMTGDRLGSRTFWLLLGIIFAVLRSCGTREMNGIREDESWL